MGYLFRLLILGLRRKGFSAEVELGDAVEAKIAVFLPKSAERYRVPMLAIVQPDRLDVELGGFVGVTGVVAQAQLAAG